MGILWNTEVRSILEKTLERPNMLNVSWMLYGVNGFISTLVQALLTLFLSGSEMTLSVRAGPLWPQAIFSNINDLKNHLVSKNVLR